MKLHRAKGSASDLIRLFGNTNPWLATEDAERPQDGLVPSIHHTVITVSGWDNAELVSA